ncbi:MAG: 3-phosphoserine/phosphohydroxythreonine transaminase [Herpetosiphon sp.]
MTYNFNAGPAVLPGEVLTRAREELLDYQGRGMSILEMSHRSKEYETINSAVEHRLKSLLGLSDDYRILLMQGGASTQFALVPMNFLRPGQTADYLMTGVWSEKAADEAAKLGNVNVAASSKDNKYRHIPTVDQIKLTPNAAYVHITTNNTIYGTQWSTLPDTGAAHLVADMSSDIASKPIDAARFGLIYAGAQKNLGPAGVTIVIVRQSWLAEASDTIPTIFQYATFAKNHSLYNTPPVFAVYLVGLVLEWLESNGGLAAAGVRNEQKASLLYTTMDANAGFYKGHAVPESRSLMNVTFRLPEEGLEKEFISVATKAGMVGLAGHRSVGGIRASIYNALPMEAVEALASFMREFVRTHG